MADEQIVVAEPQESKVIFDVKSNPFSDEGVAPPAEMKVEQPTNSEQETVAAATPEPPKQDDSETFDADEYIKKELGYDSWEAAKAAKAEYEELKKQPKPELPKYSAEEREKLLEDAYPILQAKKQLERAEKLDPSKPKDAAEIIKLDLLYKNKDKGLESDDIDYLFEDRYSMPNKPKQGIDQTDEEYAESVKDWEAHVARIERRMTIDAKMVKPELSKLKSELSYPDIPKVAQEPEQPSQESLEAFKVLRENYLKSLNSDYTKFDGFSTKVKDESVEFPISFKVSDEDKAEIKKLEGDMDVTAYFNKRWSDDKGNIRIEQMMSDLYLLEKRDKAIQGLANNAASERRKEIIKQNSNIKLNGITQQTVMEAPKTDRKTKEEAAIWSA